MLKIQIILSLLAGLTLYITQACVHFIEINSPDELVSFLVRNDANDAEKAAFRLSPGDLS